MSGRVTGLMRKRAEFTAGKGAGMGGAANDCATCGAVMGACGCGGRVGQAPSSAPPSMPPQPYGVDASEAWWRSCRPSDACFPRGYTESRWRDIIGRLRSADLAGRRAPYLDQMADYMELDTLYSDITTIAAGTLANVTVQPEGGQFLVAYYRIVGRTAADGLQQVDYTYRKPRVVGCPVPCDNLDRNIMSQFGTSTPESCPCGIPLLAWIQRQGEVLPLQVPITNGLGVDGTFQVEVRGFCCDQRICL